MTPPILGNRFESALTYAHRLHLGQKRKGTSIPYISHLLSVAALVIEQGGSEDEVIAALLHDGPEDRGGRIVLHQIERSFGAEVARIVEGCTDTFEKPKPPWRPRKEAYIDRLPSEDESVWLVSLADKVHNARAILADVRRLGHSAYDRFTGGREGSLWYYRALADFYNNKQLPRLLALAEKLDRVVCELERLDQLN